jgi:parallel beta-helix repeat protein
MAITAVVVASVALGFSLRLALPGQQIIVQPVTQDEAVDPNIAAGALAAPAAASDPNAPRVCTLPEERVGATDALYNGTDPDRLLLPYSPFRILNFPCANFDPSLRVTVLYRDAIVLLQGGAVKRSIPFDASGEVRFPDIVAAVNDGDWLAEISDGVYEMDTAFIQLGGTRVVVSPPDVDEIRMSTRRDVFFGGRGAEVLFEGVTVTSWDSERGGPDLLAEDGRAFILYERGSVLDIVDSEITYLGSDRSGAYGVSWRTGGTTGSAIDSRFTNSWFGVYTFEARDILFQGNTFADNELYGLDPHDRTTGLVVENNVAYGNGSHGLIFSRGVADSVMRNNHVYANGGNGIVLDAESNRNIIENNLVEDNKGDGIVFIGSAESVIRNNTVRGNRTAIRLHRVGTYGVDVADNLLEANGTGVHIYEGATDVSVTGNLIRNTSRAAIKVEAGANRISNVEIAVADVGIDAFTAIDIEGVAMSDVDRGVVARTDSIVDIRSSEIRAFDTGIRLYDGATALVAEDVFVDAADPILEPVPPLAWRRWLPIFGAGAILLAIFLEVLRLTRTRRPATNTAPEGVTNTA